MKVRRIDVENILFYAWPGLVVLNMLLCIYHDMFKDNASQAALHMSWAIFALIMAIRGGF